MLELVLQLLVLVAQPIDLGTVAPLVFGMAVTALKKLDEFYRNPGARTAPKK